MLDFSLQNSVCRRQKTDQRIFLIFNRLQTVLKEVFFFSHLFEHGLFEHFVQLFIRMDFLNIMFNCSFAWTFWTFCSKAWVVLEHLNNLFVRMNIKYFDADCIFAHQIDANQFVISAIFHFKSVLNYWINFVGGSWRLKLIRSCLR